MTSQHLRFSELFNTLRSFLVWVTIIVGIIYVLNIWCIRLNVKHTLKLLRYSSLDSIDSLMMIIKSLCLFGHVIIVITIITMSTCVTWIQKLFITSIIMKKLKSMFSTIYNLRKTNNYWWRINMTSSFTD